MNTTIIVLKRELGGYFATPVAYIFLIGFLVFAGIFTWHFGGFYETNQADLQAFFTYHPILYLILIPALSMRLWSEERRSGTIELLLTLPISMWQAVMGKFLAAWIFTGVALLLTTPMWFTVNYLGEPDNGVIGAAYLGSFLMAGAFLAIGAFMSSLTKNQVIAFVGSLGLSMALVFAGFPMVTEWFKLFAPDVIVDAVRSISIWTHFTAITRGVIDFRDILFFASMILVFLFANATVIELKKAD